MHCYAGAVLWAVQTLQAGIYGWSILSVPWQLFSDVGLTYLLGACVRRKATLRARRTSWRARCRSARR